jgi:glycosyltransferase involved in cell wall biosynthesis
MHVLWISDSPETPSGFGNVTRFVCEGLARRGHQVGILGWQTRRAREWNGCRLHAIGSDPMGSDALFAYLVRHRPDVVIALADVWWLPYFSSPHVRRQMELTRTPWVLYFPIDGETVDGRLPPSWVELLHMVDVPVAMSRYGRQIAANCGIPCEYIPHGVDLRVFSPPADREHAKRQVGAEGRFVVLSDSRNQPRKLLPRLLDAFARFAERRPDALLHLHTDPNDEFARSPTYSYDVRADVRHLGLEQHVRFSPGFTMRQGEGLALEALAAYYRAADVHLSASSGEGFGLPTLQAAAAGAVPMAGAYSASLELVEGHGEPIAIADWSETEFGIRRALIDVDDAAERLARLHADRELLRERSARSLEFARTYDWAHVVAMWDALLRSIGERGTRARAWPQPAEVVREETLPALGGASITVKVVERPFGRLEAAIVADARRQVSDVRLPVVPRPCDVGGVRIPRRVGRVCVGPAGALAFVALRRIFPVLEGWSPLPGAEDLGLQHVVDGEVARYELAQSTLALDPVGELPESTLVEAAVYGVPCVGAGEVQRMLWPELACGTPDGALALSRALLTDAALVARLAVSARRRCERLHATDEEELARSLARRKEEQLAELAAMEAVR